MASWRGGGGWDVAFITQKAARGRLLLWVNHGRFSGAPPTTIHKFSYHERSSRKGMPASESESRTVALAARLHAHAEEEVAPLRTGKAGRREHCLRGRRAHDCSPTQLRY